MTLLVQGKLGILIVFLLLGVICTASGVDSPQSAYWDLPNSNVITFNQAMNFTIAPHQGLPYDNSLVGYWSMDEGTGSLTNDSSGNGNNGTLLNSPTWVMGKYNNALQFSGLNQYVYVPNSTSLGYKSAAMISFGAWVYPMSLPTSSAFLPVLSRSNDGFSLQINSAGQVYAEVYVNSGTEFSTTSITRINVNVWSHLFVTFDGNTLSLYINGKLNAAKSGAGATSFYGYAAPWYIGKDGSRYWNGAIDEVLIFNRTLSASQVSALYASPYTQPNPITFANYCDFADPNSGNIMLITSENPTIPSNDTTQVTCTSFFSDNKLIFQANASAIVNIWTNLGQPVFTTGTWNDQNCTATLALNASTIAELNWNNGTPPTATNLSTSSIAAGKTATISTSWSDDQSLIGGGFILSTNNTGLWVNASWAPFTANPSWGNVSLTLNNNPGVAIGFQEYANNSINMWGNSRSYIIMTVGSPPSPSASPVPAPKSSSVASPIATSIPDPIPITSKTSASASQTNMFPIEALLITILAIDVLVAVFAYSFKKGYITIEILDEQEDVGQEEKSDYEI